MEETSEELPNFSISIEKIKSKKNSQVARFANLTEDQLQQILAERRSLGAKNVTSYQEASTLAMLAANLSLLLQP